MARYRQRQWREAQSALENSLRLNTAGLGEAPLYSDKAFDWFFLAMTHWQLGELEEAQKHYEQGVTWMDKQPNNKETLIWIRVECEQLLGLQRRPPSQPSR